MIGSFRNASRETPKDSLAVEQPPEIPPKGRRDLGRPWSVILITLSIFVVSQFVAALLVAVGLSVFRPDASLLKLLEESAPTQFFYVLIAEVLAVSVTFYIIKKVKHLGLAFIGLGRLPKRNDFTKAILGGLVFYGLLILVSIVVTAFFPQIDLDERQDVGFSALNSSLDTLLAFTALVILPPIGEEILMRGYLYSGLRARVRYIPAMLVTSVLFGVAHLRTGGDDITLWVAGINTFLLSLVLVYLRERTGALYSPILLHGANNMIAFTIHFR